MSKEAITPQKDAPLANPAPARRGLMSGKVASRYRVMPTARLLQQLSKQVENRIEGAVPGVLWDTVNEAPCPKTFIVVKFFSEAIKPRDPDNFAAGIEWRTTLTDKTPQNVWDALDWTTDDRTGKRYPPEANEILNAIVLFEGRKDPMVIPFSITGLKDGKKLYTMVECRGGDVWNTVYEWDVFERSNPRNTWWALRFTPMGNSSPEERTYAESLYNALEGVTIQAESDEVVGEPIETHGARRPMDRDPRYERRAPAPAPEPREGEDPGDYARRAVREIDSRESNYPPHMRRRE